jgi:hypothetical protein
MGGIEDILFREEKRVVFKGYILSFNHIIIQLPIPKIPTLMRDHRRCLNLLISASRSRKERVLYKISGHRDIQQVTLNTEDTQELLLGTKDTDEMIQTAEPPFSLADAAPLAP